MANTEMEICFFLSEKLGVGGGVGGVRRVSQANDSLGIVEFHIH